MMTWYTNETADNPKQAAFDNSEQQGAGRIALMVSSYSYYEGWSYKYAGGDSKSLRAARTKMNVSGTSKAKLIKQA